MALNLDMDVLRTLVTIDAMGGVARAAERIGRTQSAVSVQIHKLEGQLGGKLFRKAGRGLALTATGELVVGYARRILTLNDEAVAAVRGAAVVGTVRFGLPGDFAETWLPAALGLFKRAHPQVEIEASVDRNLALFDRLDHGALDLAVAFSATPRVDTTPVATLRMAWIGAADGPPVWRGEGPVPLALFEAPCPFRAAALAALDAAGLPWRIAFTSPSLPGLWAAIEAGLGVTVRIAALMPPRLREAARLPPLPTIGLGLHDAGRTLAPPAQRLSEVLLQTCPAGLAGRGEAAS